MASDGSIIIDTLIDTSGIEESTADMEQKFKRLTSSAKKFGAAVAAAFAVDKIVDFGIESSKAARMASDSLQGLKSILDGQGRSFSDAQKFIDEYISDGLVPMTNAVTAYKNLASRGYDDSQIQQTLIALKDASAYGRQASLSMGDAVQTATEGLKNENSVLVDNAGVTKNVAKMWDEYAASIGTTAKNLTQQQKIQAEVTGILNETRFQTGDAARVAGTLTGQIQQLSFNFNNLKVAIGNIINPFVQVFLPVINAAVTGVTRLANAVAGLVNTFFGTSINTFSDTTGKLATNYSDSADAAESMATATDKVADSTKKAEKANKSYLSGLDEINKVSADAAESTGSSSSGAENISASTEPSVNFGSLEQGNKVIEKTDSSFSNLIAHLRESIAPLSEEINRFGTIAHGAFSWFFDNVLKPLSSFTVNEVLPRFFQTLGNVLAIVNNVLIALQPLWQWFWTNVLQPIISWTGGIFLQVWDGINTALKAFADWCANNPGIIQTAAIVIGSFIAAWGIVNIATKIMGIVNSVGSFIGVLQTLGTVMGKGPAWSAILGAALKALSSPVGIAVAVIGTLIAAGVLIWKNWDTIKEKATEIWDAISTYLSHLWETIKTNAVNDFNAIKTGIQNIWNGIKLFATTVWNGISTFLSNLWTTIKTTASTKWEEFKTTVTGVWTTVKSKATEVFDGIATKISDVWTCVKTTAKEKWNGIKETILDVVEKIRNKVKTAFEKVKTAISGAFEIAKSPINGLIDAFNVVVNVINSLINKINSIKFKITVPDWVPGIGGSWWGFDGFNIPTVNKIPYLATGAVIPPNAPFMAMLGDQRNGTNLEGPEDMFRQIVREEFAAAQSGGGQYRFTAQINRRTLFDEFIEEAKMRQIQTGKNPFEFA